MGTLDRIRYPTYDHLRSQPPFMKETTDGILGAIGESLEGLSESFHRRSRTG
ncbi:MAG: hypothetical protein Q7R79_03120 [bacterium]|nr:hypothetical protein [bacterium]